MAANSRGPANTQDVQVGKHQRNGHKAGHMSTGVDSQSRVMRARWHGLGVEKITQDTTTLEDL